MERTELKFLLSVTQAAVLKARIKALMQPDTHASADGHYCVRSLYFDTPSMDFYNDNLAGAGIRKKYRLRLYDGKTDLIRSEIKSREYAKISKTGRDITEADAREMMLGKRSVSAIPGLLPVCICEYTRMAYYYAPGNVRITFDSNLSASAECGLFLDGGFHKLPVMAPGTVLMEVKFDSFLPAHIKDALNIGSLRRTSFSKYCSCVEACRPYR